MVKLIINQKPKLIRSVPGPAMVSLIFASNGLTKYKTKTAQISLVEKYFKIENDIEDQAQNQYGS